MWSVSMLIPHHRYYQEGETLDFQGVENEWPVFYLFMIIDGAFKNLPDQVSTGCSAKVDPP